MVLVARRIYAFQASDRIRGRRRFPFRRRTRYAVQNRRPELIRASQVISALVQKLERVAAA